MKRVVRLPGVFAVRVRAKLLKTIVCRTTESASTDVQTRIYVSNVLTDELPSSASREVEVPVAFTLVDGSALVRAKFNIAWPTRHEGYCRIGSSRDRTCHPRCCMSASRQHEGRVQARERSQRDEGAENGKPAGICHDLLPLALRAFPSVSSKKPPLRAPCLLMISLTALWVSISVPPTREHDLVPLSKFFVDIRSLSSCVGVWQNDRVEIIANDRELPNTCRQV